MTSEERALRQIVEISDPRLLRSMIENATGHSNQVAKSAFRRLVGLSTTHPVGSVEHDCWTMIHTIEELRRAQGRPWRMNRLRAKIAKDGELASLAYCASKETDGFKEVLAFGLPDLTAEAIVLRHPDKFDDGLLKTAAQRLQAAGVSWPV